jgi:hypothetical protein
MPSATISGVDFPLLEPSTSIGGDASKVRRSFGAAMLSVFSFLAGRPAIKIFLFFPSNGVS